MEVKLLRRAGEKSDQRWFSILKPRAACIADFGGQDNILVLFDLDSLNLPRINEALDVEFEAKVRFADTSRREGSTRKSRKDEEQKDVSLGVIK
jgi:hypothetical protein